MGYSDHTKGYHFPIAAAALGATTIEEHLVLEKDIPHRQDTLVGLDFHEFCRMVAAIREVDMTIYATHSRGYVEEETKTKEWLKARERYSQEAK